MKTVMKRLSSAVAPLLAAAGLLTGCCCLPQRDAPPAETSVRPGINTNFLSADLKLTEWVERFEKEGREVFDHRERIVREADLRPGMVVADVGAGTGLFEPLLAGAVGAGGRVIAVDIAPKFLEHIQARADTAGMRNIATVLCEENDVRLPPASVDLVFICDTYHHFEYPRGTLASIHRALRPGGQIYLVEFKRIPGVSAEWMLNHVRAGEEVFTAEIEAAGFERVQRLDFLKDNYILRFRKR